MSKKEKANAVEFADGANTNVSDVKAPKKQKSTVKKDNFFKRIWRKLVKLCKDTVGEMKKVVWTPKTELRKNTTLVIVTVVAVCVAIAIIDTGCSYLINTIAGLIG